mgnify:CR=1 FL=1
MTEPVKKPIDRIMERFKRTNPKLYKRYQQKKNEIRRQPKIPGLKTGSPKTFAEMQPYGGKYAKMKKEMTATAAQNVKRLTTQPDAYDPETRYITGYQKRGNRIRVASKKTTDQVNLKAEAAKIKSDLGKGSRVAITETPMKVGSRGFETIRYKHRNRKKSSRRQMPIKPEPQRPLESPFKKRPKKLMGGGGAGLFSFKKKKTDKEEASKENNIKKQINKKQKRLEELKKEISAQSKGGMMKPQKAVLGKLFRKKGRATPGAEVGGSSKGFGLLGRLAKKVGLKKGGMKKFYKGGMADYYKDIL